MKDNIIQAEAVELFSDEGHYLNENETYFL